MKSLSGKQKLIPMSDVQALERVECAAAHPSKGAVRARRPAFFGPMCLALIAAIGLGTHSSAALSKGPQTFCSPATEGALEVEFLNNSSQPVSFHWMQFDCAEGGGPELAPGEKTKGITYPGHIFRARGAAGQTLTHFVAGTDALSFVVNDALVAQVAAEGEPYTEGSCSPRSEGRFEVTFENKLNEPITMQWIDFDCQVRVLRQIPANGRTEELTYPGHIFRFVDSTGRQLRSLDVAPTDELPYLISEH